jgi:hypothetical protein
MFDFLEEYGFRIEKFEANYTPLAFPTKTETQILDGYRLILSDMENRDLKYSQMRAILAESGLLLEELTIDHAQNLIDVYLALPKDKPIQNKRKRPIKKIEKSKAKVKGKKESV